MFKLNVAIQQIVKQRISNESLKARELIDYSHGCHLCFIYILCCFKNAYIAFSKVSDFGSSVQIVALCSILGA